MDLVYSGIAESQSASDAFKPTRRVRTVPGGPHSDIFGHDDDTPPPAPASVTKLVDVLVRILRQRP